jgi:hypothetical protein
MLRNIFNKETNKLIEKLEEETEQSFTLFQEQIKLIEKKQKENLPEVTLYYEEQLKKTNDLLKLWLQAFKTVGEIADKRRDIIDLLKPEKKAVIRPNKLQQIGLIIPKMKGHSWQDKLKVVWLIIKHNPLAL